MNKPIDPEDARVLRDRLIDNVVEYALDETGADAILALGCFTQPDGGPAISSSLSGVAHVGALCAFLRALADDLERDFEAGRFRCVLRNPSGPPAESNGG